jgi:hypothetical protein
MKTTQDERLLDYLKDNHSINPLEAWTELGIYRLSACIHRLRKVGWNIDTDTIGVFNQFDELCMVGDYKLKN